MDADASPSPRRDQAAAPRAEEAARLRIAGLPWADIAARTGYSHANAAARAARNYMGTMPAPDRDEARAVLRARAEQLWQHAATDVEAGRPGAVRAAVALLQRIAAFDALDAPARIELHTPTEIEYERTLTMLVDTWRTQRGEIEPLEADVFADEYLDELAVVEAGGEPSPAELPNLP